MNKKRNISNLSNNLSEEGIYKEKIKLENNLKNLKDKYGCNEEEYKNQKIEKVDELLSEENSELSDKIESEIKEKISKIIQIKSDKKEIEFKKEKYDPDYIEKTQIKTNDLIVISSNNNSPKKTTFDLKIIEKEINKDNIINNLQTKTTKDSSKGSLRNSFSCIKSLNEIDSPEELHLLYVSFNLHKKNLIGKFDNQLNTLTSKNIINKDNSGTVVTYNEEINI